MKIILQHVILTFNNEQLVTFGFNHTVCNVTCPNSIHSEVVKSKLITNLPVIIERYLRILLLVLTLFFKSLSVNWHMKFCHVCSPFMLHLCEGRAFLSLFPCFHVHEARPYHIRKFTRRLWEMMGLKMLDLQTLVNSPEPDHLIRASNRSNSYLKCL